MKSYRAGMLAALAMVFLATPCVALANDRDDDNDEHEHRRPHHGIERLLHRIDAHRIQKTIETLEAFGTRNSCSDTQGPGRGITPARDFMFNSFSQIKGVSVALDPFLHANCPTTSTSNVLAWLPGTT